MPRSERWNAFELDLLRRFFRDGMSMSRLANLLGRTVGGVRQKANLMALRRPNTGRFRPGNVPPNKGKKGFVAGGRSAETRFKPGQQPLNTVPIGTEVRNSNGYLMRKVRDDAAPGWSRRNWQFVHVLNWEAVYGPVPRGHCLAFRDRDKTNVAVENLELIHRRERMRRNTIHNLPPELVEVIQLRGVLNRQIRKRSQK